MLPTLPESEQDTDLFTIFMKISMLIYRLRDLGGMSLLHDIHILLSGIFSNPFSRKGKGKGKNSNNRLDIEKQQKISTLNEYLAIKAQYKIEHWTEFLIEREEVTKKRLIKSLFLKEKAQLSILVLKPLIDSHTEDNIPDITEFRKLAFFGYFKPHFHTTICRIFQKQVRDEMDELFLLSILPKNAWAQFGQELLLKNPNYSQFIKESVYSYRWAEFIYGRVPIGTSISGIISNDQLVSIDGKRMRMHSPEKLPKGVGFTPTSKLSTSSIEPDSDSNYHNS